jgi:putative CocE/NonD family hydrolase
MALPWQDPPLRTGEITIERNVFATMRDGTKLAADIYRPASEGPWPVLLLRLPYDKTQAETSGFAPPHWYARHGYMVVVQDCRGRWRSEGNWRPFVDEAADGSDTLAWALQLPGSNGKIGTLGYSYAGANQLLAAPLSAANLAALATAFTNNDFFEHWTYRGGALHHAFTQSWANFLALDTTRRARDEEAELKLLGAEIECAGNFFKRPLHYFEEYLEGWAPYYREWLDHDCYDEYWKSRSARPGLSQITAPVLHIGGWYDIFLEGTIDSYKRLTDKEICPQAGEQKLVIGPWYHSPWHQNMADIDFGADARSCIDALQILWFDKHLRGAKNQLDIEAPVAIFVMGKNKWRFEKQWPPKRSKLKTYYLHSAGRANSLNGNGSLDRKAPGDEPFDAYIYDPGNPAFSLGGHSCCNPAVTVMGPMDQRSQQSRNDVLLYDSVPLDKDLEVCGAVELVFYAASTACDTDFVAKLIDVYPDGRAINILEGIIKASRRESLSHSRPIEPDAVYEYTIKLGNTAMLFKVGHKLRLELTSSNFPVYAVNDNSGKRLIDGLIQDRFVATQRIFHDSRYPSRLLLPTVK